MKSKFTLLLLLTIVAASCKKTTNVDVDIINTGKLTYKLLDDSGKGIPNITVSLNAKDGSQPLQIMTTDVNGTVDFGELNAENYEIEASSIIVNKIIYNVNDVVQVVPNTIKQKEVKVTDFSGTFIVTYKNGIYTPSVGNTFTAIAEAGVLFIPYDKYELNHAEDIAQYILDADYKGVTDANGKVSFAKMPAGSGYGIVVYNTTQNTKITNTTTSVSKGETRKLEMLSYDATNLPGSHVSQPFPF